MPTPNTADATADRRRSAGSATTLLIAAVLLSLVMAFWRLNATGFWGRDEGRYAEMGREMLLTGDWVTPHLMYVKYFEKPPMLYWLTALSFKSFGMTTFAGRLPAVFGALLALAAVGFLAFRIAGAATAAVTLMTLSTGLLFFVMSRLLVTDMLVSGFYTVAMVCLWFCFEENEADTPPIRRAKAGWWFIAFSAVCALAVLTKGVIGIVLPVFSAVVFAVVIRRRPRISAAAILGGVAVFLAIALPWFILVSIRNPEFLHYFIVVQHVERFTGQSQEHVKPWWFFLGVVVGGLLPWTGFLMVPASEEERADERLRRLKTFLWIWAAVVVVFFSASAGKLIPYVLPAIPAFGVLLAVRILAESTSANRAVRWCGWCGAVWWLLLAGGMFVYGQRQNRLPIDIVRPLAASIGIACLIAAVLWAIWSACGARRGHWLLTPVLATTIVWLTLWSVAVKLEPEMGRRTMCDAVTRQLRPGDLTVLYRNYEPAFAFYTRTRPILFDIQNELAFGMKYQNMDGWYRTGDDEFIKLMHGRQRVFCFTDDTDFAIAKKLVKPIYIVAEGSRRVIFSNRPSEFPIVGVSANGK